MTNIFFIERVKRLGLKTNVILYVDICSYLALENQKLTYMKRTFLLLLLFLISLNLFSQWSTEKKEGFDYNYKGAFVRSNIKNGYLEFLNYGSKDKPSISIYLKFDYQREAGFVPNKISFRFNNSSTIYSTELTVFNVSEYRDNKYGVTIQKSLSSLDIGISSISIKDFIELLKQNQKIYCRVEENNPFEKNSYKTNRYDLEFTLANSSNALNYIY
jgi:hypothetical protein